MTSATATAKPSSPAAKSLAQKGKGKDAPKQFTLFGVGKTKQFKKKELIGVFRGLGSMLRAQINTADALKYYSQGLPNKVMVDTLTQIREDIASGINVHEAFRRTGRFNDMVIGLIQAGSDAGQLHQAFGALAGRFTSELYFTKAMRKATMMPAVVISVLTGAFIVSQVKIVPQVEDMLGSVNQEPDGLTAISFAVSHTTQKIWPVVVAIILGLIVVIWQSSKIRNMILGLAMSKWRLLRLLIMSLRQMTFLSTIKLLHSNGINLAKSIRVSANSVKGTPFYKELRDAADKYENSGVPLSTAFSKYTSVDTQVVHMMSIGEKSASLDSQLEMLTTMYEEDAETHMATFTATVNFLVLLIAVGLIAAVFIGTFLPIFLMGPKMMNAGV
ncbi:type II secretion system F family protein [Haloferula rosea]|uniref:Type II secretion system F family protein n=1 Tax=Haloferula rosea TaxID=490093 RepID=A0A934R871_9BACT|nr:type II secretion system F family protein [Haloferula rosea]MBK1827039.1 type II secretion system F family protein [Haloferula rosea]